MRAMGQKAFAGHAIPTGRADGHSRHPGLMRRIGLAGAFAAAAMLAGCTSPFEARVQTFQALPAVQGQSFTVRPQKAAEDGLEFRSYATLVSDQLRLNGFVPASGPAQYEVLLDYGTGQPRERLATRPGSGGWGWYGSPWYYSPRWWGGYYDPFWGPGWNDEVYSYTIYPTWITVQIVRVADKQSVYEGRAETLTRVNDMPATMPKLVATLFKDFPGAAASSRIVKLKPAK